MKCATIGCQASARMAMEYRIHGHDEPHVDNVCDECAADYSCRTSLTILSLAPVGA